MRVLSGVANLASEFDCSYFCSFFFRDLKFFRIFQDFSKNLDMKSFTKIENLISISRFFQDTPGS